MNIKKPLNFLDERLTNLRRIYENYRDHRPYFISHWGS